MDRSNNRDCAPDCPGKVQDEAGGHGSTAGYPATAIQPWVPHPSRCRILLHPSAPPSTAGCVSVGEQWPCRAVPCRAVPCRAVRGLQQLFPWAGHGHAGRALCSKQHQRGERQLLILLSFLSSFNYRSYLSAENRKIVTITLHLPL